MIFQNKMQLGDKAKYISKMLKIHNSDKSQKEL